MQLFSIFRLHTLGSDLNLGSHKIEFRVLNSVHASVMIIIAGVSLSETPTY